MRRVPVRVVRRAPSRGSGAPGVRPAPLRTPGRRSALRAGWSNSVAGTSWPIFECSVAAQGSDHAYRAGIRPDRFVPRRPHRSGSACPGARFAAQCDGAPGDTMRPSGTEGPTAGCGSRSVKLGQPDPGGAGIRWEQSRQRQNRFGTASRPGSGRRDGANRSEPVVERPPRSRSATSTGTPEPWKTTARIRVTPTVKSAAGRTGKLGDGWLVARTSRWAVGPTAGQGDRSVTEHGREIATRGSGMGRVDRWSGDPWAQMTLNISSPDHGLVAFCGVPAARARIDQ